LHRNVSVDQPEEDSDDDESEHHLDEGHDNP
jgi:hypothetical protein